MYLIILHPLLIFAFVRAAENRTRSTSPSGPRMCPAHPVRNKVGVRRIELRHLAPKASVLPVYDTPTLFLTPRRRTTGILRPAFASPELGFGGAKPVKPSTGGLLHLITLYNLRQVADSSHAVSAPQPHEASVHLPLPFPPLLKDIPLACPRDLPYLCLM